MRMRLFAFRPEWEGLGKVASRLGLSSAQQLVKTARELKAEGLIESRYKGGCLQWRISQGRGR